MEACLVHGLWHHEAQATENFGADGNADQRHPPVGIVPFTGRQHRRHDDSAGMHGTALKRVIKILAMRGSAVDEGRTGRGQRARMPDCRAGTVIVAAGKRARDVILVAGGNAEPDDVDQQILAFARRRGRKRARLQRDDLLRKRFGDGNLRQFHPGQTRNSFV